MCSKDKSDRPGTYYLVLFSRICEIFLCAATLNRLLRHSFRHCIVSTYMAEPRLCIAFTYRCLVSSCGISVILMYCESVKLFVFGPSGNCPRQWSLLPLDEAIASKAAFVIVSGSDVREAVRTETKKSSPKNSKVVRNRPFYVPMGTNRNRKVC